MNKFVKVALALAGVSAVIIGLVGCAAKDNNNNLVENEYENENEANDESCN